MPDEEIVMDYSQRVFQTDTCAVVHRPLEVTDEMVERAARVLFVHHADGGSFAEWDNYLTESYKSVWRDDAHAVLSAALRQEDRP